jgi:hypothetical protein
MASRQGKTTNTLEDYVETKLNEERKSQWGEMRAQIVSWDPVTQKATVQPLYKPKFNGSPVDMPQLEEVPIRFQRAGPMAITFPVKPGMELSIRPQMRSTENDTKDGDRTASDDRSFSLSDMEGRFDGGTTSDNPIKNFDNENANLRFDEDGNFGIKGNEEGKVKIATKEGELMKLLADALELIANDQLQINHGSSAGSGHAMQNKTAILDIVTKMRGSTL